MTHQHHEPSSSEAPDPTRRLAASATLHCLAGCATGEILGLIIGTAAGLSSLWTIVIAIALAFFFGYLLSTLPLLSIGLSVPLALRTVLAADTLSITTMEIVDNLVMAVIPGAMGAGLLSPRFWLAMMIALTAAYAAAYPVNRRLLRSGKGHALVHEYHHGDGTTKAVTGWRYYIPNPATTTIVAAIAAFLLGGLTVALAAEYLDKESTAHAGRAS